MSGQSWREASGRSRARRPESPPDGEAPGQDRRVMSGRDAAGGRARGDGLRDDPGGLAPHEPWGACLKRPASGPRGRPGEGAMAAAVPARARPSGLPRPRPVAGEPWAGAAASPACQAARAPEAGAEVSGDTVAVILSVLVPVGTAYSRALAAGRTAGARGGDHRGLADSPSPTGPKPPVSGSPGTLIPARDRVSGRTRAAYVRLIGIRSGLIALSAVYRVCGRAANERRHLPPARGGRVGRSGGRAARSCDS